MEIKGKYYESIEEINSIINLKKVSVIRNFFGADAADVYVSDKYVRLSFKTRATLRSIPNVLDECTEFLMYQNEGYMQIDLYYYVNE